VKGSGNTSNAPEHPSDAILRAKYLDYCSARVTDALLRLSPDEMYLLAQGVEGEASPEGQPLHPYSEIVRRATGRISMKLALPEFADWVAEYLKDPERFESELLGLWTLASKDPGEIPD